MKAVLVQLDDNTYRALNRYAPAAKRKRSQFIRDAIRRAIMAKEYERIREAYERQPDTEAEWTDWSLFGEYKA